MPWKSKKKISMLCTLYIDAVFLYNTQTCEYIIFILTFIYMLHNTKHKVRIKVIFSVNKTNRLIASVIRSSKSTRCVLYNNNKTLANLLYYKKIVFEKVYLLLYMFFVIEACGLFNLLLLHFGGTHSYYFIVQRIAFFWCTAFFRFTVYYW